MLEIKQEKSELRRSFLEKRAALSPALRAKRDGEICRFLLSGASYRYADILLLYYPTENEVNILPVFEAALAAGKRVAFPRCRQEDRSMTFHFVTSKEELSAGAYGIFEPREDLPAFVPEEEKEKSVLCIVPGLVFDRRGYRIGYGGGYYDRFFGKYKPASAGVVYGDFILPRLPHGRFDISVDAVISERGIHVTGQ